MNHQNNTGRNFALVASVLCLIVIVGALAGTSAQVRPAGQPALVQWSEQATLKGDDTAVIGTGSPAPRSKTEYHWPTAQDAFGYAVTPLRQAPHDCSCTLCRPGWLQPYVDLSPRRCSQTWFGFGPDISTEPPQVWSGPCDVLLSMTGFWGPRDNAERDCDLVLKAFHQNDFTSCAVPGGVLCGNSQVVVLLRKNDRGLVDQVSFVDPRQALTKVAALEAAVLTNGTMSRPASEVVNQERLGIESSFDRLVSQRKPMPCRWTDQLGPLLPNLESTLITGGRSKNDAEEFLTALRED